ncbi:uncharacterized protein PAC_05743 [Phialocephala subalpina]|uniref:Uncharacterized protein n=1 Tax=Phialocephala subalpina TaxID=576137 RepID=A0A1L7WSW1_9HELO|nr:uncharacterized protein PAC_05743 [Phialocephala subalpina]
MSSQTSDSKRQGILQSETRYEAPLRSYGSPEEVIPGSYAMWLYPGHSLQQHFDVVLADLKVHISGTLHAIVKHVIYIASNVDDELLAAIRSDPGVDAVDFDYRAYLIE